MGGRLETDSNALGVLGLAESQAADLKVFVFPPHSSPPPREGTGVVVRRSALQRSGDKNVSQTPLKPICVQYGFRFFDREKSKSVASTAKRQRGIVKGEVQSPLTLFCFLLQEQKEGPRGER